MKILQVNKFYYPRGGADKYFLSLSRYLEASGQKVATFSMQDEKNEPSPWSEFFVSPIDFNSHKLKDWLNSPFRLIYSLEAKKKFIALLNKFQPDIIHVHNIYHQLSPSILDAARKRHIPVIMHLHDYKIICPNYQLFIDGAFCDRCRGHKYYNCVMHRCLNKSWARSAGAALEMYLNHDLLKIYEKSITHFVAPSQFMKQMLINFGWPENKITVIYNPYDPEFLSTLSGPVSVNKDYFLYFGRLSQEKGLLTLIQAAEKTKQRIIMAGSGPQEQELKNLAEKIKAPVEFLGQKNSQDIKILIQSAQAIILPSIWPENMPLSLLEAMSLGKIIIASHVGGLPELINHGENGFLFQAGDAEDLANKIKNLRHYDLDKIRAAAKKSAASYSPEKNTASILNLYQRIILKK